MSAADTLLDALALPPEVRVDQRVPKTTLLEHAAPTAADRRLLQRGVEALRWVAVLKPSTVGIAAYRDAEREVDEIVVLAATLHADAARPERVVELLHRSVPYPAVLVTAQGGRAALSLAPKRLAQGTAAGWVVEHVDSTPPLDPDSADPVDVAFRRALALSAQPAEQLHATYGGWLACVAALAAARVTGRWALAPGAPPADYAARRAALAEHARLVRERAAVYRQATGERQLARRVALNESLRDLDARLARVAAAL